MYGLKCRLVFLGPESPKLKYLTPAKYGIQRCSQFVPKLWREILPLQPAHIFSFGTQQFLAYKKLFRDFGLGALRSMNCPISLPMASSIYNRGSDDSSPLL